MPVAIPREAAPAPPRRAMLAQFLRFGATGTLGFVVDTVVLYAAIAAGAGLYGGRCLSYLAAATTTWAVNRAWTFREAGQPVGRAGMGRQWALFLLVNLAGFAVNYGTYAFLVSRVSVAAAHPVVAVAAGALAGMTGNFFLSRRLVFRSP
ncbi:GtrA family protein [Roseomonas sp. WA12]